MTNASSSFGHELEPFRVDVHPERETVRVVPVGEIDMATVGEMDERMRDLRDVGFRNFVLDLREVRFMDSSGLRLILGWDAHARENGISFALIEGPAGVQRVFEIAGVLDDLPFVGR
jgi:stage II sporulation protein AA (anti-sigma F factor antagonist)